MVFFFCFRFGRWAEKAGLFASLCFAHDARGLLVLPVSGACFEKRTRPFGPIGSKLKHLVQASLRRYFTFEPTASRFGSLFESRFRSRRRRKRDSNPRSPFGAYALSRRAPSATRSFLLNNQSVASPPPPAYTLAAPKNGTNGFANIARIIYSGKKYCKIYGVSSPRRFWATIRRDSAGERPRPNTYISFVIAASGVMSAPPVTPARASR